MSLLSWCTSKVTPDGLEPLVNYFDATYVTGSYRQVQIPLQQGAVVNSVLVHRTPEQVHRTPAMFPPPLSNMHQFDRGGGNIRESRTNNSCASDYLESH